MALIYFRNISSFKPSYCVNNHFKSQLRFLTSKSTQKSSQIVSNEIDDPSKPIEFLKSDASRWKAHVSRSGAVETGPWYQPYVISISLSIFMVYFFYLREESDIDLEFDKSLYDRVSGLEEKSLEAVLQYNKENNIPTSDVEQRLQEIRNSDKK